MPRNMVRFSGAYMIFSPLRARLLAKLFSLLSLPNGIGTAEEHSYYADGQIIKAVRSGMPDRDD